MTKVNRLKKWFWIHRWTSLVCTFFLLILCITGLPLVFAEEISNWTSDDEPYAVMPANTPRANLDSMVQVARHRYPKDVINSVFIDDDEPQVVISMLPSYASPPKLNHALRFDSRTAKLLSDKPPLTQQPQTFINFMFYLHANLFLNLPGELFLALIGILFVLSIISGIVLYGPFMTKLDFGTIRQDKSRRLEWLDLHNLLGIATAVWLLVVGFTGVMNELSTPLFGIWQMTDVRSYLASFHRKPVAPTENLSSLDAAYRVTQAAVPDRTITSIIYPGSAFGSPYQYVVWTKGNQPLTSRLFNPALVDPRTGMLDAVVHMPVYLRALELSRPLHFGDYGGIPLKILWAVFDLIAIVVLISGLYLWFARRKFYATYFSTLEINETDGRSII